MERGGGGGGGGGINTGNSTGTEIAVGVAFNSDSNFRI